jgi:hypothetical protein
VSQTILVALLVLLVGSGAQAQIQVPSDPAALDQYGDVAVAAAGSFVVVWDALPGPASGDSDRAILGRRFDATGVAEGPAFQVNSSTTGEQAYASVATAANGRFVVVWFDRSASAIAAQRYDATGTPLGGEFPVSTDPNLYFPNFPAVAMNASGEFAVSWTAPGHVVTQRWDATGNPVGAVTQVDVGPDPLVFPQSAVAIDDNGIFTVAWSSNYDGVNARRLDASGNPLGLPVALDPLGAGGLSISANGTGKSIVAWKSGLDVFAARFDAAGAPLGTAFQVNTDTAYDVVHPDVSVASDGSFMVVWEINGGNIYNGPDGQGGAVAGRRFDAAGVPIGDQFQLNSATAGHQERPAVAGDGSGAFVVTWDTSQRYPENRWDVVGQRFDAAGVPLQPSPIAFTKLLIKEPTGNPAGRKLVLISKSRAIDTTTDRGIDPSVDGASLHVFNSAGGGDDVCLELPAAGWTASGDPTAPKFTYQDAAGALGPCRLSAVRPQKVIKISCAGGSQPLSYSLDEASQGRIAVAFASGSTTYCGEFEGTAIKADEPGRFLGRGPLEALQCPEPPSVCP